MPRLATGKPLPENYPNVWQGRSRSVQVHSAESLIVHVDGEFFCLPEDGVRELQITILPAALRVLPDYTAWLQPA
jgi:diacylglycerol kinase family enzyme